MLKLSENKGYVCKWCSQHTMLHYCPKCLKRCILCNRTYKGYYCRKCSGGITLRDQPATRASDAKGYFYNRNADFHRN